MLSRQPAVAALLAAGWGMLSACGRSAPVPGGASALSAEHELRVPEAGSIAGPIASALALARRRLPGGFDTFCASWNPVMPSGDSCRHRRAT